jgi:hypothetical protein
MTDAELLQHATRFRFGQIEVVQNCPNGMGSGAGKWCVRRSRMVLSRSQGWIWGIPYASEIIAPVGDARFDSAQEAIECLMSDPEYQSYSL